MTRAPYHPTVHALPVDARQLGHRASPSCPCQPTEAADMAEPIRPVFVHRPLPEDRMSFHIPPDTLPEDCPCADCRALAAAIDADLAARRAVRDAAERVDRVHKLASRTAERPAPIARTEE